jgi:hypothetical protein
MSDLELKNGPKTTIMLRYCLEYVELNVPHGSESSSETEDIFKVKCVP